MAPPSKSTDAAVYFDLLIFGLMSVHFAPKWLPEPVPGAPGGRVRNYPGRVGSFSYHQYRDGRRAERLYVRHSVEQQIGMIGLLVKLSMNHIE